MLSLEVYQYRMDDVPVKYPGKVNNLSVPAAGNIFGEKRRFADAEAGRKR
jgi:hypothetical protein